MKVRILGSGAGGGVPQWNCGCPNCRAIRAGATDIEARTQDAIAVNAAPGRWVLCNASPDIRQQIEGFSELHPRGPRHTPLAALILTNGDLDHVLGLFSLRESQPLAVYATPAVFSGLMEHNVLLRTLQRFPGQLSFRPLALNEEVPILDPHGEPANLWVTARPVKGKVPVHLDGIAPECEQQNVGLWLRDATGATIAYVSAAADLEQVLANQDELEALLLDGTFWSSDELCSAALSSNRAEDMAHLPIGGPHGSLASTPRLKAKRRIYTHINNTNPILRTGSRERRMVEEAGWEVARDGMGFDTLTG